MKEYQDYGVTVQMLAMVVYDWIDSLHLASKKTSITNQLDIFKADPSKIMVFTPQPLLYCRYGRYDESNYHIDEIVRDDFDFFVPRYDLSQFKKI